MPSFTPPPTLEYAAPAGRRSRLPTLRPSVAIAMIACGGVWGVAPCLSAAWVLAGQGSRDFPDQFMGLLIVTALCGLLVALLGAFLSARHGDGPGGA